MDADCNTASETDGVCSDMFDVVVAGTMSTMQLSKPLTILAKGLKQVDSDGDGSFDMKMDKNADFIELGMSRVAFPKGTSDDYIGGDTSFIMNADGLLGLSLFDVKIEIQKRDSGIQFALATDSTEPGRALVPLVVDRNDAGQLISINIPDVRLGGSLASFVVVTGSAVSLLSQTLAESLGIEPTEMVDLAQEDRGSLVALASNGTLPSGNPGPLPTLVVPEVEFPTTEGERVRFSDVRFLINTESDRNIIGTDLLNMDDHPTVFDVPGEQAFFGVTTELANVSSASFLAEAPLSPASIASGFGQDLAADIEAASELPLPTELQGTVVEVTDSRGTTRTARLFFVSPEQVNYLIPEGTALGQARVTVFSGTGATASGEVQIESVAPALYGADASGSGVAAALFVRVEADGTRTEGLIFDPETFEPAPISLGEEGDEVFLSLFGTGIRGFAEGVSAQIGGQMVPVLAAVAQGQFEGLDQVNLGPIPRSLAGTEAEIELTIDQGGYLLDSGSHNM